MIKSFKDAEAEKVFRRQVSRRLAIETQQIVLRKLPCSITHSRSMIFAFHRGTASKGWRVIGRGNIASGPMIDGVFALNGAKACLECGDHRLPLGDLL